ncbi:MAG: ATPase [Chloroflexi bacterium]|nr:ATPase [Chloroflexota bacterium]
MASRVVVALRVSATPERAFDTFTREIGQWWRPNMLFQFTPRGPGLLAFESGVGGRFTETFADGAVFEIGRVSVWEPPSRIAFSWRQASFAPEQSTEVDIRFEPVGEETRVPVEHLGWDTIPTEHVARHGFPDGVFLVRHAEWWNALLSSFRARATASHDREE